MDFELPKMKENKEEPVVEKEEIKEEEEIVVSEDIVEEKKVEDISSDDEETKEEENNEDVLNTLMHNQEIVEASDAKIYEVDNREYYANGNETIELTEKVTPKVNNMVDESNKVFSKKSTTMFMLLCVAVVCFCIGGIVGFYFGGKSANKEDKPNNPTQINEPAKGSKAVPAIENK